MKINGNIDVVGFANIKLPTLTNYTFDVGEKGKLYVTVDGELKFNNGTEVVTIINDSSDLPDLIPTLGVEWVNADGTFNPTNLNTVMASILNEPLTGSSSLYDVIAALSSNLSQFSSSVNKYQNLFSGSNSYTVYHNLGELYCNVSVIEGVNLVPSSQYTVEYSTTNSLSITFTQIRNVTIVVMG